MSTSTRMHDVDETTNPVSGTVRWRPTKSLWYSAHLMLAGVTFAFFFSWQAALLTGVLTAATLCFGHSVGLHRLLIHRSFKCPLWLEYFMVYTGTLVGMGGPKKMLYMHDIRDWSQRHPECNAFYVHRSSVSRDWFWNLHCELELASPPKFVIEDRVLNSRVYAAMDRLWMLTQLPVAMVLFSLGGIPFVLWGISVRIALSLTGHWLVGYLAHNVGERDWHVDGAAVQGYNVPGLGLITMGEAWHNNHHAFPESARLGLERGQNDAGWWLLRTLGAVGLVWDLRVPDNLPERPELKFIGHQHDGASGLDEPSSIIRPA